MNAVADIHDEQRAFHVASLIRRLSGGSQPLLMVSDEGSPYVVKLKENPQGTRVLFNELVSSRIANLLGVSVPDYCIAKLDKDAANELYFETPNGRRPVPAGLHYASKVVIDPVHGRVYDVFPESWLFRLRDPEMLAGLSIFHLWLRNIDRPQFLYWRFSREKKFQVTSIDHGHCLGGPEWRISPEIEKNELSLYSLPALSRWYRRLARISSEELSKVFENIPEEWGCNEAAQQRGILKCLLVRQNALAGYLIWLIGEFCGSNGERISLPESVKRQASAPIPFVY